MEGLTVCLPDLRFTRDTARLDEKFFREQIVREDQPGCFSSPDCSLLAEEREGELFGGKGRMAVAPPRRLPPSFPLPTHTAVGVA